MKYTLDQRIQAMKAILSLTEPTEVIASMQQQRDQIFSSQDNAQVASKISHLLYYAIQLQLNGPLPDNQKENREFLKTLWQAVSKVIRENPNIQPLISREIHSALTKDPAVSPRVPAVGGRPAPPMPDPRVARTLKGASMEPAASNGSPWQYVHAPIDRDFYGDSDARAFPAPAGYRLIGARVRGKKHKHDGTNCDDWFEADHFEGWTVIAVADGAGSKKYSRIGARVACNAAVEAMKTNLSGRVPPDYDLKGWELAANDRDADLGYQDVFVSDLAHTLRTAIRFAYERVDQECHVRQTSDRAEEYARVLGRPIEVADLSSTLLLVIHRVVVSEGHEIDLVITCQVGDGMSAAIHRNGSILLLGKADGGEFSGETEFLTSNGKREDSYLNRKTFIQIGGFQAIMVMTDGVADDYFPNDSHLDRLWADLLVNRIPDVITDNVASDNNFSDLSSCDETQEIIGENPQRESVLLRSSKKVADVSGVPLEILAKQFSNLHSLGSDALAKQIGDSTAEQRLQLWLDTYSVRGSFDDRTLVVLHREKLL